MCTFKFGNQLHSRYGPDIQLDIRPDNRYSAGCSEKYSLSGHAGYPVICQAPRPDKPANRMFGPYLLHTRISVNIGYQEQEQDRRRDWIRLNGSQLLRQSQCAQLSVRNMFALLTTSSLNIIYTFFNYKFCLIFNAKYVFYMLL